MEQCLDFLFSLRMFATGLGVGVILVCVADFIGRHSHSLRTKRRAFRKELSSSQRQ